jgi:general secretion pathway protein D
MGTRAEDTVVRVTRGAALLGVVLLLPSGAARAQDTAAVRLVHDSVTVRLVDTDLRAAIQALGRYLPKSVVTSNLPAERVTLETPGPVPQGDVLALLRALVESRGLQLEEEATFYRIGQRTAAAGSSGADPRPAGDGPALKLFVIRLKHAKAAEVAATVNLLFGGSGQFAGRGLGPGTLADELRRDQVVREVPAPRPATPTPGEPLASALAGQVTIVPDERTNSLLLRASQADFVVLQAAVEQVDIRPLQVLIEVLIVEARHDRSFLLGSDISVPPQRFGGGTIEGTLNGGVGLGDLIIRLMSLGKADIDATLRMAASRGDVDIISRPVLLASNNTEARFLVGSQRPFVQVQRSLPTESANRDQVVQYKDVGTRLSVLPTINQDGYVSLIVQQEINEATSETQFDAPIISTREARTQVLVRDGQTIVIGGLRDVQRNKVQSGVPVLSAIPLLGGLFGAARRGRHETEVYIFLTPRIIRTDEDADRLTAPRLPPGVAP